MKRSVYRLLSLDDTRDLAREILAEANEGRVVGLWGDLGAGKTTLVRYVVEEAARSAGRTAPRVVSPTFVLHQAYAGLAPPVEHFDLYRLERAGKQALLDLGYFEALERTRETKGLLFVEWPDRADPLRLLELELGLFLEVDGEGRKASVKIL